MLRKLLSRLRGLFRRWWNRNTITGARTFEDAFSRVLDTESAEVAYEYLRRTTGEGSDEFLTLGRNQAHDLLVTRGYLPDNQRPDAVMPPPALMEAQGDPAETVEKWRHSFDEVISGAADRLEEIEPRVNH